MNGTSGGVTCTRSANTPNVYGYLDEDLSSLSVIRMAWYTDLSLLTIGTDGHNTALMRNLGSSGSASLFFAYRASGALRYGLYIYNNSGVTSTDAEVFGLPEWFELRLVRASSVGASDGEGQVYAGGGDYAPLGELLLEATGVPNYTRFGQVFRHIAGMHNALAQSISIGGSIKFDEWTLRNDDTPILFGVGLATSGRPYDLDQLTDLTTIRM